MKNKETLEEVCDKVLNYLYPNCKKEMSNLQYTNSINSLKSIAKWQQEQDKKMYSEEDMFDCWKASHTGELNDNSLRTHFNHWFEQFKKK